MASEQYDVSEKIKKLFFEKQKQRAAAKEYYMKYLYNPYRTNEAPFDISLHRFSAMSAYHTEHFKPTSKTFLKAFFWLAPFAFMFYHIKHTREKTDKLLRSGVISYKDRAHKFLY